MEKDAGRYMRAVVIVMITAFCAMSLPHQDKSIFHLIIPTIKLSEGSRLYLNGILPLVLLLWSYKEIVKSKYFKCGKLTIFIIMFFVLVPFTFKGMNVVKVPYYLLSGGLKSIEVIDSDYSFYNGSKDNMIKVNLNLKNYGKEINDLKVAIDLPKELEEIIDEETIVLPKRYTVDKERSNLHIEEVIKVNYKSGFSEQDIFDSYHFYDDYKIILSTGDEQLVIVQRGE